MNDPKAIAVDAIIAYREQARILREANDVDSAALYEKLADSREAELDAVIQQQGQQAPVESGIVPNEVLPAAGLAQPSEGLGRV